MFNRPLDEFKGSGVVIGCAPQHYLCDQFLHGNCDAFYSIDMNASNKPDCVLNIMDVVPQELKNRFHLTLLECIDYGAYNAYEEGFMKTGGITPEQSRRGFANVWDLTQEEGFILIAGSARIKECRKSLHERRLKYIELDDAGCCLLVPKNQALDLPAIKEKINKLDPALKLALGKARVFYEFRYKNNREIIESNENLFSLDSMSSLEFCKARYEDMPVFKQTLKQDESPLEEKKEEDPSPPLAVRPRALQEFQGQGVVIGCAHHGFNSCDKSLHEDASAFYTIDIQDKLVPDRVFNIGNELPSEFQNRFQLTLLEQLPWYAYNAWQGGFVKISSTPVDQSRRGFENIWNMTKEDGFILIVGGGRQKEYRSFLYERQLKYIELDSDGRCLLIPKNQALDISKVIEKINELDYPLKNSIIRARSYYEDECQRERKEDRENPSLLDSLIFCATSYDDLPTLSEEDERSRLSEEKTSAVLPPMSTEVKAAPSKVLIDARVLADVKNILVGYQKNAFFKARDRITNVGELIKKIEESEAKRELTGNYLIQELDGAAKAAKAADDLANSAACLFTRNCFWKSRYQKALSEAKSLVQSKLSANI